MQARYLIFTPSLLVLMSACMGRVLDLGGDAGAIDLGADTGLIGDDGPYGGVGNDGGSGAHVLLLSSSAGDPQLAAAGWILFDSDRDQLVRHIFAARADGSGVSELTSGTSTDTEPAVAPDGSMVAFTSDRAGTPQVFILSPSTRAIRQLTTGTQAAGQAAFSPDGKMIAFHSGYGVSLINVDGTGLRPRVVDGSSYGTNYEHPIFTLDGAKLVVDRLNEIDEFDLAGQNERAVVGNYTADESFPTLSRDGVTVAFITACNFDMVADDALELASLSGTLSSQLGPCGGRAANVRNLGSLSHPSWGPGTFIAVSHTLSNGLRRVAIVDAANLSVPPVEVAQDNGDQQNPDWAPSSFSLP